MAAALPGQTAQATPRTDAATPRAGGGAAVPAHLMGGLKKLDTSAAQAAGQDSFGAQLSARTQAMQDDLGKNLGNLSARVGNIFAKAVNTFNNAAELVPTAQNRETRAARKIQTAWRSCAARGHFRE